MRLSNIHRSQPNLIESFLSLMGWIGNTTLNEAGPLWPQEWAENAIYDPKFTKWLKSLGITGPIGDYMHGNVGRAYPVGKNHIVKFTADHREAQAAATLQGHDSKHAADIYGVHRVSSHDHNGRRVSLYAIAMERLNTGVGGRMRAAGNAVYAYLDVNSGFIEDPEAVVRVVMDKYVDKKMRADKGMKFAVEKVVSALYDVQQKTGVLSQDPHGGNVALKGREPAFFDFGRSSQNFDHPKAQNARITALPD